MAGPGMSVDTLVSLLSTSIQLGPHCTRGQPRCGLTRWLHTVDFDDSPKARCWKAAVIAPR